jgi:hypothetical protein
VLNNPLSRTLYGGAAAYGSYSSQDPNALLFAGIAFLAGKGSRSAAGALAGRKVNHLGAVVRGGGQTLPGGRGIIPLQTGIAFQEDQ